MEQKVYDFHYLVLKEENFVTAESLKSKLLGTDIEQRMLIPIFQEHNDKVGSLSGTLQNLRINRTLSYTRVGGTLYYNYKDIEEMLKQQQ
ncbi:DNA-binding protein [Chryseobacterium sp. NRRL B-14859]|uniref:DNA-binding protein n=1 Tax=Chryseobacterium sp. NRRL B-14859 TaxID=1562763 RepID=UPI003394E3F1